MRIKGKSILISTGIAVMLIAAILCAVFIPAPKASKIYQNNLQSIVEVKASSETVGESFGTAEFIDKDGTLITNAHVATYTQLGTVNVFEEYSIRFAAEEEYRKAELVKYDTALDIAVLRLEDTSCEFAPIKTGDSSTLRSGDKVYAIGNTVNYGLSISQGMVGMPLIKIEYAGVIREVIQCDLTIAEGNSGGALLDERGRLLGITTFRTKDNAGNVIYGLAYCIPIHIVMEYVGSVD